MIQKFSNGKTVLTFSDTGHKVIRDGVAYDEAIDPAEANRVYSEAVEYADEPVSAADYWSEKVYAGEIEDIDIPPHVKEWIDRMKTES